MLIIPVNKKSNVDYSKMREKKLQSFLILKKKK